MTKEDREAALWELRGLIDKYPHQKLARELFEALGFMGMADEELQEELLWYRDYDERTIFTQSTTTVKRML